MKTKNVIEIRNLEKKYKNFHLSIPSLNIPCGFTTVIAGENGAGKTTLLNILAGLDYSFTGDAEIFQMPITPRHDTQKSRIGFAGGQNYFLPHFEIRQVKEMSQLLFPDFESEKFLHLVSELQIAGGCYRDVKNKNICTLSDGNLVKLMLATVLSRKTDLLILDEPTASLDPLMREKLDTLLRDYMTEEEKSIVLSTHNISDMENLADYLVIMENGTVAECGFTDALREKYVEVSGENPFLPEIRDRLLSFTENHFGFDGIALRKDFECVNAPVKLSSPSLKAITLAVMKKHSHLPEVNACD